MRPFPDTRAGRWQVSNGGGAQPVWAPNGRELFYGAADGHLVAAEVRSAPTFAVTRTTPLFDVTGTVSDAFHQSYAVGPGARWFLAFVPRRMAAQDRRAQVVWVDRWSTELEARVRSSR